MAETQIPTATAATGAVPQNPLTQSDVSRLIAKDYVGLRLLITRKAGDPQVAADLLNDAVCTAWEKWGAGQIQRPEQIAGYIFQVAMNLLRNRRRSVADRPERRAAVEQLDSLQVAAAPADVEHEEKIAARLKELIRALDSQRDRTILVRFYLDEEDKESICGDLRLSPLQFDKVLHRARQRLRQLLTEHGLTSSDFLSVAWLL